jgi:multicomponent Na+:H+ antiporter subunit B
MKSIILETVTRALAPLMLVFSVVLLLVGHNQPGGGFAGGLVAASALALVLVTRGGMAARAALRVSPVLLLGAGLLVAVVSGLIGVLLGGPFLTGFWLNAKLGTPLLFDVGVYLVVIGAAAMILFELGED